MLVNRVTGQPLATMLSEKIWQPLGMEQDATWLTDRPMASKRRTVVSTQRCAPMADSVL
jgi:CubicO group peptidase (beta-lactamase class C family)